MTARAAAVVSIALVAAGCIVAGVLLWRTSVPGDLALPRVDASAFPRDAVARAERFEALQRWISIAALAAGLAAVVAYARRGPALVRESAAGPIGTGFLLGMLGLCVVWLAGLPFGLLETWWSRRHDVIEVGYADWIVGSFSGLIGSALAICVVLLVAMGFARLLRAGWWVAAAVVLGGIVLLFAFAAPVLAPGLDRPSRGVAKDAHELARVEGLPDVPVRVEQVREFTQAPNAYAFGLGSTRKVVLWDTLAEDFPREEVRVTVAHELGHHRHHHIAKGIGWTMLFLVPAGLAVALVTRRRGRGGLADPATVPLALLVVTVAQLVALPLQSASSRRYEAEADWAALQASKDPKAMEALFDDFTRDGLADPDPPGWYHAVFDGHPSGAERVAMARAWARRYARQRGALRRVHDDRGGGP